MHCTMVKFVGFPTIPELNLCMIQHRCSVVLLPFAFHARQATAADSRLCGLVGGVCQEAGFVLHDQNTERMSKTISNNQHGSKAACVAHVAVMSACCWGGYTHVLPSPYPK